MLGSAAGKLGSVAGVIATPAFVGYFSYAEGKEKVAAGWNPTLAYGTAIAKQAALGLLNPWAQAAVMGAPVIGATVQALGNNIYQKNMQTFQARMPFSARFEHTDVSYRMQIAGLQAINNSWGHSRMGAEAGAMAQRYGR